VAKTAAAGGLVTKDAYDGAGRLSKEYQTDGGNDSTWNDAMSVSGNNVLTQVEPGYDANGNVTQVITRRRFDDETATGGSASPARRPPRDRTS
jgi:hypothetical protein